MNRSNAILSVIVLSLAVLMWLTRPQMANPAVSTLSSIKPESVEQIKLELGGRDAPSIILSRQDAGWMLLQPIEMPADPAAVAEILRLLNSRSQQQLSIAEVDLKKLKLNPPLWRVSLDEQSFSIGGTDAINGYRYVGTNGQIHLVADLNANRFDNNYADLVSRKLLPQGAQVTLISIPDSSLGQRQITWLNPSAEMLFQHWQQAQAQWMLRPSDLDFQQVHSRINLQLDNGHSLDFLIHSLSPRLELIRPELDLMYVFPESASSELIPGA